MLVPISRCRSFGFSLHIKENHLDLDLSLKAIIFQRSPIQSRLITVNGYGWRPWENEFAFETMKGGSEELKTKASRVRDKYQLINETQL